MWAARPTKEANQWRRAPEPMLTEVANTLWNLQRADQLAGLDPQQLLANARARREAASRAMQVVVLPVPVAIATKISRCWRRRRGWRGRRLSPRLAMRLALPSGLPLWLWSWPCGAVT